MITDRFHLVARDANKQTGMLRLDDDTFIVRTPNATVCVVVATDRDGHALTMVLVTPDSPFQVVDLEAADDARSLCTRHPDANKQAGDRVNP